MELTKLSSLSKKCHTSDHEEDFSQYDVVLCVFPIYSTTVFAVSHVGVGVVIAGVVVFIAQHLDVFLGRPKSIICIQFADQTLSFSTFLSFFA